MQGIFNFECRDCGYLEAMVTHDFSPKPCERCGGTMHYAPNATTPEEESDDVRDV